MTMNDVDITLLGDKELLAALRDLDYKTQHKYLKRIASHSGNILTKAARDRIPVRTGKKESIGKKWHPPGTAKKAVMKKMGKSRKTATVFVGPRTGTGDPATDAWYMKFWEYGTSKMRGRFGYRAVYESNKKKVEDAMLASLRVVFTRALRKVRK